MSSLSVRKIHCIYWTKLSSDFWTAGQYFFFLFLFSFTSVPTLALFFSPDSTYGYRGCCSAGDYHVQSKVFSHLNFSLYRPPTFCANTLGKTVWLSVVLIEKECRVHHNERRQKHSYMLYPWHMSSQCLLDKQGVKTECVSVFIDISLIIFWCKLKSKFPYRAFRLSPLSALCKELRTSVQIAISSDNSSVFIKGFTS